MDKPVDKNKQAEKDAKKVLDSYYEVLKHKLGRAPDVSELLDFAHSMSQNDKDPSVEGTEPLEKPELEKTDEITEESQSDTAVQPEVQEEVVDPDEPEILNLKIYHGAKKLEDGSLAADENKILYYETIDGRVYDVHSQDWLDSRPPLLDSLIPRPLKYEEVDVISAIINGVVNDNDYCCLEKAGLISDNAKSLWEKTRKLNTLVKEYNETPDDDIEPLFKSDHEEDKDKDFFDIDDDFLYEEDFGGDVGLEGDDSSLDREAADEFLNDAPPGYDAIRDMIELAMKSSEFTQRQEDRIKEIITEFLSLVDE